MKRKKPCTEQIGSKCDDKHICSKCNKEYTSYISLYAHTKRCTGDVKVVNNTFNQKIDKQLNVGGDVKVVKFGEENISYISDDLYKHILGRGFKAVSEFIEHSHFNSNHPENHNIYIANIKTDYVIMYDGNKWTINKKDDVMEDIIYAKSDFLNLKFQELMDQMDERDIKKFKSFINQRDEDSTMNKLKEELKLQLYNNRYMPQQLRKSMNDTIKPLKVKKIKNKEPENKLDKIMSLLENMDDDKLSKMESLLNRL